MDASWNSWHATIDNERDLSQCITIALQIIPIPLVYSIAGRS